MPKLAQPELPRGGERPSARLRTRLANVGLLLLACALAVTVGEAFLRRAYARRFRNYPKNLVTRMTTPEYDVEIAIPWETLTRVGDGTGTAPTAGEEWRIALYVLDLLDAGATASAWSAPLVGVFHVPDRFGRVILDP